MSHEIEHDGWSDPLGPVLAKDTAAGDPQTTSGTPERALGSDPFDALDEPDPFLLALSSLEAETGVGLPQRLQTDAASAAGASLLVGSPDAATTPSTTATEGATPLEARRWIGAPPLCEVDIPQVESWLDRLLGDDERRRLAALTHLLEGETAYDPFGLSLPVMKRAFPIFYALYRHYFRVASEGHEHLPRSGPAVVASNHAGLLPFDGAMMVLDILLNTDPPRLPRTIVDRWAGSLPFVNVFYARVGQIVGTPENFAELLREGQLMLVFPEGMNGVRKLVTQRYRLQSFHVGFVEQALRGQAPIVPAAVIGSDDQAPILFNLQPIAKALGLPMLPVTPTFPLLGPLGLLPYPVKYRIVYGEPLRFHERFGPEDAEDGRLVRYLARQVRVAVQSLIDRHR